MRLSITHVTEYWYDDPVPYGLQELRMTPIDGGGQTVVSWTRKVDGGRTEAEFTDQHGNAVQLISFEEGLKTIRVTCSGLIETEDRAGILGVHTGFAPLWYFRRPTPFTRAGEGVRALTRNLPDRAEGDVALLHALLERVSQAVAYEGGATVVTTTAEEAVTAGRGVCQDQTHVFISGARVLGYPARYVSGYLLMDDRTAGEVASHAWSEVHVEGLGWVGFDVSNRISPDARYVRLATGLDYRDAAPISGMRFGDGSERMSVRLSVEQQ